MTGRTQTLGHTFLPLKSARKSDEVFDQIARFIRNGRFQPGANPVPRALEIVSPKAFGYPESTFQPLGDGCKAA